MALLRTLEFGEKRATALNWYYGARYTQSFRIYVEALINSPKRLSLARDTDLSCDAKLALASRPRATTLADFPELMQMLCKKIYKRNDKYKKFCCIGTSELTQ